MQDEYKDKFPEVFKSITFDNGIEFSKVCQLNTEVYFTHPYSAYERGQNERFNRMLRKYIPKKVLIENFSSEDIEYFCDEINNLPTKVLGYRTSQELFDEFLDEVYKLR